MTYFIDPHPQGLCVAVVSGNHIVTSGARWWQPDSLYARHWRDAVAATSGPQHPGAASLVGRGAGIVDRAVMIIPHHAPYTEHKSRPASLDL